MIGVTVLTSLDNKALKEIGFSKDVKKLVLHQAKLASKAKLDGIVCSPHEIKIVKKVLKRDNTLVLDCCMIKMIRLE